MEQTIGKRIMYHRKRLSLTQDQLAEQLDVTAQAVSKWENNQSCPDIATIPKLATIFCITTDELLGYTLSDSHREQDTVSPAEDSLAKENSIEFHYDNSKHNSFAFAALVLLVGIVLLCSKILEVDVTFWNLLWPSALLIYGIFGLYPHFSIFRFACLIFGTYMLLCNLSIVTFVKLPSEYIAPIALLLIGTYLLFDARKKPKKPEFHFQWNGKDHPESSFSIEEDSFQYKQSFKEDRQLIDLSCMSNGLIETNFGDYTFDLSGVERISPNCTIHTSCNFGEQKILIPKRFRVENSINVSLAECTVVGTPDVEPEGLIQILGHVSLGKIVIQYL